MHGSRNLIVAALFILHVKPLVEKIASIGELMEEKKSALEETYASTFRFSAISAQSVTSSTSTKRASTVGQSSAAANSVVKFDKKSKKSKINNPKGKEKADKNSKMTTNVNEPSLKDLSHPSFNDQLKAYNTATFKLVKTGKNFFLKTVLLRSESSKVMYRSKIFCVLVLKLKSNK